MRHLSDQTLEKDPLRFSHAGVIKQVIKCKKMPSDTSQPRCSGREDVH